MLNYLKEEANRAYTENGAAAYATAMSGCLDLFSTIGALRGADEGEIIRRFSRAWAENPDLALKILFFARDVRGGLGERRVFRTILRYLAETERETILKNLRNIPEYGRFDDLLALMDTPCQDAMTALTAEQLKADAAALESGSGNLSLLAKWMPSVNASNAETVANAKRMARAMKLSDAGYRKLLSRLRSGIAILENNLRERDYSFDYERQPSRAMFKYRRAFLRNDEARYRGFLEKVRSGEAVLRTGVLYPYDVIAPCLANRPVSQEERAALDTAWNALPDFTNGENALAVVDGSGSMYWAGVSPSPAAVALSLGVYFAQRNRGAFQNHFITFSERPRLVEIKGRDLFEQVRYCAGFNEAANTDIEAVFELILSAAVKNRLRQSDLPAALYVISDMEFDRCARGAGVANFENAKRRFAGYGFRLPRVVFWNVASRNLQQPVTMNEQGVALVSGCTPRVFEMAMSGELSPYRYMLEVLGAGRYAAITA